MSGIVVCVNPQAADEGALILEAGGNAFDAAVATAFVQMVVTPFSCGIGGMVSALLWRGESNQNFAVDGLLRAGSLVTDDMWASDYKGESDFMGGSLFEDHRSEMGYTSICAPGAVSALSEIHRHLGSMPWSDLLQPAIRIARNGFLFTPVTPSTLVEDRGYYEPDPLTRVNATDECSRLFYRDTGTVPADGEMFRNPDYADTLQHLAEHGPEDFYTGDIANTIATDLERNGAFVTRDDLAQYCNNIYSPDLGVYRGHHIRTNLSPGGGPLLLQALRIWEGLDIGELEHSGADHLAYIGSTLQLINQERRRFLGDLAHLGHDIPRRMASQERVSKLREAVLDGVIGGEMLSAESPDTTHLTIVDGKGDVACITHSNGQHSGVVTPGLGFVYNNGMSRFDPRPGRASSLAPRKTRVHMMTPTLVFKDGKPAMILGAPGGNAIVSALLQTISNVVDFGMDSLGAVSATRIHAEGSTIWHEARVRGGVVTALQERGFTIVQRTGSFAQAQLVLIDPDGELTGASDPRGNGGVVYVK
jgi:gamma-glutamyltranspeptidase/glutathione hydrolase